ncbi:MAG: hypothetical protein F2808_07060 [Actinobacteria bacterium]|uniref:Unannotated protein n=1 Tax=freshwater metagenome TaxID=449393 RepID=A0A6J7GLF7_9ZZZZ|nr:hypothetical protein [Actinomycetota bacterium]
MPLIRLTDVPPTLLTWDPVPLELAREWCTALLANMPLRMSPSFMNFMQAEVRGAGITDTAEWIWLAKEFHAAGFTPKEWLQLTEDVLTDFRATPGYSASNDEYVPNGLITLAVGTNVANGGMIRLQAHHWIPWLQRTRAGETSLSVVTEMLKAHWGESATVIPFGEFTLCSL